VHNQHSFIDDTHYQKTHSEEWRQSRLHEGVSPSAYQHFFIDDMYYQKMNLEQ
jgi:hypothetical protein